jgi:formate hydrogenlyase subunit 3/multisubunit Na+/H+ antiporter MnhD subunit
VFGSLAAFANTNLKRLLAYSTIANMGFILLALGWGGPLGVAAAIVNAVNHALIKASLFLSGGYLTERAGTQDLARLGGIAGLTGAGTTAFGLGAAALAGLPPLNGFLSKLTLLRAGLEHGDAPLLAAAVAASALGIAVNLRAFVLVFWGALPDATGARWQEGASGVRGWVAPLALVSLCVLIGVWPGPLLAWAAQAAHELGHPAFYIEAVLGGRR